VTKILNISLYDRGLISAVRDVVGVCASGADKLNRCISATGAHGLVYAQQHPEFAEILQSFYCNLPDGMPGVWIGRLKGAKAMDRCYGPDFFREVVITSRDKPIRHFFCGGNDGVADELKHICEARFGNHNIVGTYSPPFREMTDRECQSLAEDVNQKGVDILWIGISTPKQETFAHRLVKLLRVHFLVTVGAAFDFHTGKMRQAPRLIQKMGLEWLFRLCMEPRRLHRRYLQVVPLFILYNLREVMRTINPNDGR
jgi:N-acetylglucosaminyldiphosphoundecaprenol N-acetyl-beta-D-mannosaminyltransferase